MIIHVLPERIPKVWEIIKFTTTKVGQVKESNQQVYLNKLLHDLLSSKAQCYLVVNKAGNIKLVSITQIIADSNSGGKLLWGRSFYAFETSTPTEWGKLVDFLKALAKKEECSALFFSTQNKKVIEIGEQNGFVESHRIYKFEVGDNNG